MRKTVLFAAMTFAGAVGLPVSAAGMEAAMATSVGMGDTVRSNPDDPGSVYAAPGMVWLGERFDLGAGGGLGTDGVRTLQVGAYDGQTSNVGLGVSWLVRRLEQSPAEDDLPGWRRKGESFSDEVESSVIAATLGGGGVHHLFGFGVGLRYYYRSSTLFGSDQSFNVAPSIAGVLADHWTVSLTVENPLPLDYADAPMAVGTGTRWQPTSGFAVAVDTLTDLGSVPGEVRFTPMVGMEARVHEAVPLRVGWLQDGLSQTQFISAGIGASNESMGFNYGVRLSPWATDGVEYMHRMSLRISM
jgi:hypothetical protein